MFHFLKNIFSKKKIEYNFVHDNANHFKTKVEVAKKKCIEEKKQEIKKIENVNKWAKDIIIEIFDVPTAFWYEEMNEYENIKFHENNLNVNKILVNKTDLLIKEYRDQIKLSNSKIVFCDTLINEYTEILERYEDTIKKINQIKREDKKLKLLNKHKKRIAKMRLGTSNFEDIYEKTEMLDILNNDINNIEDDFKIKQEVTEYIENLDKEFYEDANNTDSISIKKEIEKLTSEIKTK